MFRGHSQRSLDPKGRLMLPPEYREAALDASPRASLMLTTFDSCVLGYTLNEWERIEQSLLEVNILDKRQRDLQRLIIGGVEEVGIDKQGRILIPPSLRLYGRLEKDVVLVGVVRKFEIWDLERFEARRRQTEETFEQDMAALAEGGFELKL